MTFCVQTKEFLSLIIFGLWGWRCPWCNGYRRRKWTRRHEFKSWTRLIAFHIALIPLDPLILPSTMGKIVGQTEFFSLGEATSLGEGKL